LGRWGTLHAEGEGEGEGEGAATVSVYVYVPVPLMSHVPCPMSHVSRLTARASTYLHRRGSLLLVAVQRAEWTGMHIVHVYVLVWHDDSMMLYVYSSAPAHAPVYVFYT
jgi:hypothetical protein